MKTLIIPDEHTARVVLKRQSQISGSLQVDASSRASECYTVMLIHTLLLQLRVQSFVASCLPMRLGCFPEIDSFQKYFSFRFCLQQNQHRRTLKAYTLMGPPRLHKKKFVQGCTTLF